MDKQRKVCKTYRKCIVCGNKNSDGATLFRFPKTDNMSKQWLCALDIPHLAKLSTSELTKRIVVCDDHFCADDFSSTIFRRISKFAIPSLNLHNEMPIQPHEKMIIMLSEPEGTSECDASSNQSFQLSSYMKPDAFHTPAVSALSSLTYSCYPSENVEPPQLSNSLMENSCLTMSMDFICTLPLNLCLKPSEHLGGIYKVWSLEDIPIGVRFGPFKETYFDINKNFKKEDLQWQAETNKEEITIMDEGNEIESDWFLYVNYAHNEEKRNMITFRTESGLYYITCRSIRANTELIIHDQDIIVEDERGIVKKYTDNAIGITENGENDGVQEYITSRDENNELDWYNRDKYQYISHNKIPYRKTINENHNLILHKRIQTGRKIYECIICGRKFTRPSQLIIHERAHTGERPFECNVCGKKFSCRYNRTLHVRIHTGEKPYQCSACGKKFRDRSSLTSHERIHTGSKSFECNACGKKLTTRSILAVHKRIHSGEMPFECNACGKKFAARKHLFEHKRIHADEKPFECNACGKKYTRRDKLIIHERTHTGEKPFDCNACGKKFNSQYNLTIHERMHTGEKPFQCNACGKKFNRKIHLEAHKKIHTAGKPLECSDWLEILY